MEPILYSLGNWSVKGYFSNAPIYIEQETRKGEVFWVVRAQLGGMNPHYLNTTSDEIWRYKVGSRFKSAESAVSWFNHLMGTNIMFKGG